MTHLFEEPGTNRIYIVVTQTGTMLSRMLKVITHARYNHVSVTLDPTLNTMYSFGRKNPYNPFWGGFVMESPHFGTFKRFPETDAVVICVTITDGQKQCIEEKLEEMYQTRDEYRYNTLGLFLAGLKIHYHRDKYYYCSEFVKALLDDFGVLQPDEIGEIPKPIEFLSVRGGEVVYEGKLRLYSSREN